LVIDSIPAFLFCSLKRWNITRFFYVFEPALYVATASDKSSFCFFSKSLK